VTDIMGEISAASSEQSAGVAQVGEAVTQMDQATQQNAALVEESAAAADSLLPRAAQVFSRGNGSGFLLLESCRPRTPGRNNRPAPLALQQRQRKGGGFVGQACQWQAGMRARPAALQPRRDTRRA
jgi:hypothetical protein